MTLEEFKYDILENEDYRNLFLENVESYLRNLRSKLAAEVEKKLLYEKDCTNKKSINAMKESELQQKINTEISSKSDIKRQKEGRILEIRNAEKLKSNMENELKEAKQLRDDLSSKVMNLEREIEERRNNKVLQWDAIKQVCNTYKVNLNIHISLQEEKDCQYIKVAFFTHNKETKDKYFVQLSHSANGWKIENVEPKLKKEYYNKLSIAEDSSENPKVLDITLFLCEIRNIFLKYYT